MTTLITGGSGTLGRAVRAVFPGAIAPTHAEVDVGDAAQVEELVRRCRPTLLVHCAALTGIVPCETDKSQAYRTNVQGTQNLVQACVRYVPETYFVHISTACVFAGDRGSYVESDLPYPKNFYALTKLLAEPIVSHSQLTRWLTVRTNFVGRHHWPYPRAFTDRFGTYLFADDLARALKCIIEQDLRGVVHVCGQERLSMYDLARITTPDVQPMTLADYEGPPLTRDMTLNSERIAPFTLTR